MHRSAVDLAAVSDLDDLPPASRAFAAAMAALLGPVPHSYRVLMHSPHVAAVVLVRIGLFHAALDYSKALPFLLMLPAALDG